jgi:hypothetical protein
MPPKRLSRKNSGCKKNVCEGPARFLTYVRNDIYGNYNTASGAERLVAAAVIILDLETE